MAKGKGSSYFCALILNIFLLITDKGKPYNIYATLFTTDKGKPYTYFSAILL